MPDQRRARKMVQYHDEGEHVFPEPECPSCRAERLDAALKRAAVPVMRTSLSADQERVDEALRRAAEMLDAHKAMPYEPPPNFGTCAVRGSRGYWWAVPEQALEGWAEAIRALRQFFDGGDHMTSCNLSVLVGEDCTDVTCSPFCREVRNAVATFIKAMLGGDDEQH